MQRFKNILLVLDPGAQQQPALERAADLALIRGPSARIGNTRGFASGIENTFVRTAYQ